MYTNVQKFNDGLRIQGQVPVDDRLYLDSLQNLYITTASYNSCPLYGRAYKGMIVVLGDTNDVLVCKNAEPYTPGKLTTSNSVNATNYLTYWKDITDKSKMVDGDSIKVVQDKFTGTLYKINKLEAPTGVYASYALAVKTPGSTSYVSLTDTKIDIPELEVVDEVHVCKAYQDSQGVWHETSRQGDPNWASDTHDVYLHIIWNTMDDDGDTTDDKSSETYIKVSDMIEVDISDLQRQIDDVSTRLKNQIDKEKSDVSTLNGRIADVSTDVSTLRTYVNTTVENNVSTLNATIKDVSTRLDNSVTTINNTISNLSTNVHKEINDVSSDLRELIATSGGNASTYFKGLIDNVSTRLSEQITKEANDIAGVNTHLGTLDTSYSNMSTTVTELTNHLNASVAEAISAYSAAADALDDVSTQEMVMAAAIIQIKNAINENHSGTFSAGAMTMDVPMMRSAVAENADDAADGYNYVIEEVDMTPVFAAEIGAEANIDLRTINTVERYIIKNNIKIEIEITYKEDTENIVFYYDFMDATAFKREFVEIGMNEESSLVVLNKKTVKLCKV